MSVQVFSFEGSNIRTVVGEHGETLFVGKDVCEVLGYKDPTTAIRSHCRGVQAVHPILDSLGRTQEVRVLTEADLYRLIIGSTLPAAQKFETWVFEEVLPAIRKTGAYSVKPSTPKPTASEELEFWNLVVESLNLAPSAKLAGIRSIAMGHGMTNTLPNVPFYAIDAPAGAVAVVGAPTSAEPVASLSVVLKQNRIQMSSVAFNKLLVAQGYVQELTRPSTANASVLRKYKAVTEKGLTYGKNVVADANPKETQPMWYISKFAALAELVLG